MNAIVPLNITAIRVSANDHSNVVSQFKGRTAVFENMPFSSSSKLASTGDMIVQPLESGASPQNPLGTGIHLHWELPDYFRRGMQPAEGGDVVFPQAPNRWLVIRYLRVLDAQTNKYGSVQSKCWIVESDFVAPALTPDADGALRPAVSVPLPANPPPNTQPFMYMGRVVAYESWSPGSKSAQNYLPAFKGSDGKPLYLTSIGFVGPSFSAYHPECCSVFGFWDHFKDLSNVFEAITGNIPIQFKVSYQVIGWINEPDSDPLTNIAGLVADQYNQYVQQCQAENVAVVRTPADEFASLAVRKFRWEFNKQDITFTLRPDKTLNALNIPERTLCGGIMQEIVWNMLSSPETTFFLNNPDNQSAPAVWTDAVELAVGNTTVEALSALLKQDMGNTANDPKLLDNYEYLLNALQLGLLHDLETQGNALISLEEDCHSRAFSQLSGGYSWVVEQKQQDATGSSGADSEVTLPLAMAEQLNLLNQAQKNYDQGRAALDIMRKQLFMDWIRYVKIFTGVPSPNVDINVLSNFLLTSKSGELKTVIDYGNTVGILLYLQDPVTAEIVGLQQPSGASSLAAAVWTQHQATIAALAPFPNWQLRAVAASPFWMPTDPVLVMEGDRLEPVRRNGPGPNIAVRLSSELLNRLRFEFQGNTFVVATGDLSGLPRVSDVTPMQSDVQALIGEAYLLAPMLAVAAANALKSKGGTGNPAVSAFDNFVVSLNSAQGGFNPLEGGPDAGLFAIVHATDDPPAANPTETVSTPLAISVTFTNDAANGWAPNAVDWNTQMALPEFDAARFDPFFPVFLVWSTQLDPLTRDDGSDYAAGNLTGHFSLDADGIDYQYKLNGDFTTNVPVRYGSSVTLSKTTTYSITNQIDNYVTNYPTDQETEAALEEARRVYQSRKIISQGLGGFNIQQTLRTFIPMVTVQNLVKGGRDTITTAVKQAAIANPDDDWYDFAFNSQAPIATGLLPLHNFGPLRSGFAAIFSLEIVDVFGQRMTLNTSATNPDGSLQTIVANSLKPVSGDTANLGKIFLPPRLLAPTRLWFNWLSSKHDNQVTGVSADFVEMNSHPATTPVCGWVMPNHLDDSLFFYDADGTAIGSFGVEHGNLKYRTRAGNLANPQDLPANDIGPKGEPTVNAHLADFMWYVHGKDAAFLLDLMQTIENSDQFINPANFAQDASLAVFIGRPLALTRAVIGLETSGNLLPLSQADTSANDPFPQDVKNNRFRYADRQQTSSAKLGAIQFPVRLGDLANIDDGLVGYLIDLVGPDPYDTFFSPAAPAQGGNGVVRPSPDTIELTLNAVPIAVTMLIDPRAPVHATTGILPVQARQIPPDQYAQTIRGLAVTFFTHPMLSLRQRLVVPLPQEAGYQWSWITPGSPAPLPLQPNAANEFAVFGYSPQSLLEGWLRLEIGDEGPQPPVADLASKTSLEGGVQTETTELDSQ